MQPEMTSSVTFTLISPSGFPILFTVRDMSEEQLLDKIGVLELRLADEGYAPGKQGYSGYPKKEKKVVGECPKCKGQLIEATKKDGTTFKKCENNKWDFNLKKNVGSCDYIEWGEPKLSPEAAMQEATPAQEKLIKEKFPFLWEEGMTKAQASEVISSNMKK